VGDDENYKVRVSTAASIQFRELRARAEKSPNSTHAKLWDAVRKLARDKLCLPQIALSATHALENKQRNFANIYSCGLGERHRIIYLASSKKRQVTILMMGFRKAGDANDVYEELYRRLHSGEFDSIFAELEVTRPPR